MFLILEGSNELLTEAEDVMAAEKMNAFVVELLTDCQYCWHKIVSQLWRMFFVSWTKWEIYPAGLDQAKLEYHLENLSSQGK